MRIYVASLADYNAGRLHGTWIDIDGQDVEEIDEKVQGMLAESREPVAEEWAIHDYEDFGAYQLSEWENFNTVALLGKVAEELDDEDDFWAFTKWLGYGTVDLTDYHDDPDGLIEAFREQYRGHWDSFKDFVLESEYGDLFLGLHNLRHVISEAGYDFDGSKKGYQEMFERLTYYIDWDMVARDLESDFNTDRAPDHGIYVFETEA